MAGNRYDNGQGADPRQGWSAPAGPAPRQQPGGGPTGEPEYFTAPVPGHPGPGDGYADDGQGHTRAFPVDQDPYGQGGAGYGQDAYGRGGYEQQPYGGQGYDAQGYGDQGYGDRDNVAVYRAGGQVAPRVSGPRPTWKELLVGIYREPARTFDRMRDHQAWLPALTVSLVYGVLAVLGMGATHDDIVNSTFSVAAWALIAAAIGFAVAGAMLGAVTYALARQLGGDGPWQSTVGLAVLIGWTSDTPRLLLALFLPTGNPVVQVVGWITWLICAVLLTTMVRRVHDLPWGKAAGAAALQLLALLVLIKLPTLS
ncbi:Yip1 family protein [Streptomyces sp. NRRL B-24484]|uniref:Yip1 family protein n=1 Tax=Streptomyces sp. NRRL B-24484 TaxID=1463833 RepID=UPI000694645A|nr:Yip1 family protein [Streptomyces sp. NRRL B-24484]